jgi:hypothetical protein
LVAVPSEIIVITGEIAKNQGIINTWRSLLAPSEAVMATSFGAAFMLTEGVKLTMVLAHGLKNWLDRKQEERDNKLRKEGRAEERQLWEEWNARRLDAETRGQPFSEPPPTTKP